ncbi:MAG: CRISPR-associated protein Cas8a1/Csx13 [Limnoraphis sp.]
MTDNLSEHLPWWSNFFIYFKEKDQFKELGYHKDQLNKMIENSHWDIPTQKLFIQTFHEALRRIYGQVAAKAKKQEDNWIQFDREYQQIYSSLTRITDFESFQSFICQFWARGSRPGHLIPTLQEHWDKFLFQDEDFNWEQARNLALLALASYKGQKKNSQKSSESEDSVEEKINL